MQNISCAHVNLSLVLPLFITCLAACEQQSVGRDRVTLLSIVNVGPRIRFISTTRWCHHLSFNWRWVHKQRCCNLLSSFLWHDGPSVPTGWRLRCARVNIHLLAMTNGPSGAQEKEQQA